MATTDSGPAQRPTRRQLRLQRLARYGIAVYLVAAASLVATPIIDWENNRQGGWGLLFWRWHTSRHWHFLAAYPYVLLGGCVLLLIFGRIWHLIVYGRLWS